MSRETRLPPLGFLLLAALSLGWGINWVFMKTSLNEIPLWQYRAVSLLVAGFSTLALAWATGARLAVPRREWGWLTLAALFNVTAWHVFSAFAILLMPTGQASLIAFTMPVWAAILGVVFLREALTPRRVAALFLGIGGIVVLLSRDFSGLGASPLGGFYAVLAAIGWAAGTIVVKHVPWTVATLPFVGWQLLIGAVPVTAVALLTETLTIHEASPMALGAMIYTVFVAIVFCYYAWFKVVGLFPTAISSIGTLAVPVVALLSGAAVFGEPLTWRELAAVALVLSALALVLIQRQPAPQPVEH